MVSELHAEVGSRTELAKEAVVDILSRFLADKRDAFPDMDGLPGFVDMLSDLVQGGKKMRPTLCIAGWYAGGGVGPVPQSVRVVAASLEMFHACALIHDDVMDRSTTRRGRPTIHTQFADSDRFWLEPEENIWLSNCAAILVGDLALSWTFELLHSAELTPRQRSHLFPVLDTMRTEAIYGQYLDLAGAGNLNLGVEDLLVAVRYKTAKYTLERPLHAGAALAGADAAKFEALSDFALPLGEAFQLRDDLLDVFGDPAVTGKRALDDIRECRNTVLVKVATTHGSSAHVRELMAVFGKKDLGDGDLDSVRALLSDTGAPEVVEKMILERYNTAMEVLESAKFPPGAAIILEDLARAALWRHA